MKVLQIIVLFMILPVITFSAGLRYEESTPRTKIFFSYEDRIGHDALVKGKIISISTSEELVDNDLSGILTDKTKATVRLIDNEGIHADNTLYVIDPNNLVVSKIQVKYLFDNKTLGNMLIGYGNLKLSNKGYRVVKEITEKKEGESFIYKTCGDFHYRSGDKGKAIAEYKKAVEMDKGNPSARLALGLAYYRDGIYNYAYAELFAAYKSISSLYDNEDKFILLKSMAELRAYEAYQNNNIFENRVKFRNDGIKFCKEALKIHKNSVDVNYLLGEFYFRKIDAATNDDKLAKNMYLKVLELNDMHSGANSRLSELYLKYNNREKGLFYAKKAAEADPSNMKAVEILKPHE